MLEGYEVRRFSFFGNFLMLMSGWLCMVGYVWLLMSYYMFFISIYCAFVRGLKITLLSYSCYFYLYLSRGAS